MKLLKKTRKPRVWAPEITINGSKIVLSRAVSSWSSMMQLADWDDIGHLVRRITHSAVANQPQGDIRARQPSLELLPTNIQR